jgi:hypothetical protein
VAFAFFPLLSPTPPAPRRPDLAARLRVDEEG